MMVSIDAEMSVQAQTSFFIDCVISKTSALWSCFSPNMFIACKIESRVFLSPTKNLCKLELKGTDSVSVTCRLLEFGMTIFFGGGADFLVLIFMKMNFPFQLSKVHMNSETKTNSTGLTQACPGSSVNVLWLQAEYFPGTRVCE